MGIDRTDYVVIGTKLDYETEKAAHGDNVYEHWLERKAPKPLSVVFDGMCGEYIVVGKILATAKEHEGFEFMSLHDIVKPEVYDEVRLAMKEFGLQKSPEILIFSHFS